MRYSLQDLIPLGLKIFKPILDAIRAEFGTVKTEPQIVVVVPPVEIPEPVSVAEVQVPVEPQPESVEYFARIPGKSVRYRQANSYDRILFTRKKIGKSYRYSPVEPTPGYRQKLRTERSYDGKVETVDPTPGCLRSGYRG